MKIALNKSRSSRDRYYLVNGSMGSAGKPSTSPNHKFEVANGIDRGLGYQGYMSVTYALSTESYLSSEVKEKLKRVLIELGYNIEALKGE